MARNLTPGRQLVIDGPRMLVDLLDEQRAAQERVWDLGRDLVLAGTTYAALARMLGVSAQAARQRFGPHVERWRSEHPGSMPWDGLADSDGGWAAGADAEPDGWSHMVAEAVRRDAAG